MTPVDKGRSVLHTERVADALLSIAPALTLLGSVGLIANIALSFEEPHGQLLLGSAALLLAGPAAVGLHLLVTSTLTTEQKRAWLHGMLSFSAAAPLSAYFNADARQAAATLLMATRRDQS